MALAEKCMAVQEVSAHINSPRGRCGMDLDRSHYVEVWRSEDGKSAIFAKKREFCPPEEEERIIRNMSEAYYRAFDSLDAEDKFRIFEQDGCEALIDGQWQVVDRDYYIKALGLEGKVQ